MRTKTLTRSFNVLFTPDEYDRLERLAEVTGSNMSLVVRRSVAHTYLMACEKVPTCASGLNCFVPQMHNALPKPPHEPQSP